MGFNSRTKPKDICALSIKILHQDVDGATQDTPWGYRRVLGQLNFLKKSTRPDIAHAVHQCTRFRASPKSSHKQAMLKIVRYLMKTRLRGMMLKPKGSSLELWCDADFCGNWNPDMVHINRSTMKSRTGYIMMFAGCPLTWVSKLQMETIPIMNLVDELRERKF